MEKKIALVTGATAGIGASYAKFLVQEGFDLVLVARDRKRLNERAKELSKLGAKVEVISADLATKAGQSKVEARLLKKIKPIEVLINNAGFGINKAFSRSDREIENELLEVLVTAPMRFTHAVLPAMKERNSGVIINVSSVASFSAGGSYSAAKSYLTVLSESIHTELEGSGVKITALCPGFTHTEFHARGKMNLSGLPEILWLSADDVVRAGWRDAIAGKAISIPSWQYKFISSLARLAPRPIVRKIGMNVRVRQRQNHSKIG